MENLKRFYLHLISGFALVIPHKSVIDATENSNAVSNRVSKEVNHYRTHFFNL